MFRQTDDIRKKRQKYFVEQVIGVNKNNTFDQCEDWKKKIIFFYFKKIFA